ncbi:hypothetical protein OF001_U70095 [Pseudomonas sp. OF001]|nr:hypothetical protein OF001_U70095 [Pseudomonas sp. OF001]
MWQGIPRPGRARPRRHRLGRDRRHLDHLLAGAARLALAAGRLRAVPPARHPQALADQLGRPPRARRHRHHARRPARRRRRLGAAAGAGLAARLSPQPRPACRRGCDEKEFCHAFIACPVRRPAAGRPASRRAAGAGGRPVPRRRGGHRRRPAPAAQGGAERPGRRHPGQCRCPRRGAARRRRRAQFRPDPRVQRRRLRRAATPAAEHRPRPGRPLLGGWLGQRPGRAVPRRHRRHLGGDERGPGQAPRSRLPDPRPADAGQHRRRHRAGLAHEPRPGQGRQHRAARCRGGHRRRRLAQRGAAGHELPQPGRLARGAGRAAPGGQALIAALAGGDRAAA